MKILWVQEPRVYKALEHVTLHAFEIDYFAVSHSHQGFAITSENFRTFPQRTPIRTSYTRNG